MLQVTRRTIATLLILVAALAGSLGLVGLTAQAGSVSAHALAGGPFCCGQQ